MHDPRLARLADLLVNYSTKVRKGDLVKIIGSSVCEPLLVEIFKATVKAGGQPYITMTSDAAAEEYLRLRRPAARAKPRVAVRDRDDRLPVLDVGQPNTSSLSNADP
jgi:aminopeptidase